MSAIGDWRAPKVRLPGGGGGAVMLPTARRAVTWRTEHSTRTLVDKLDFVTAAGGLHGVVTPIAVFEKRDGRLALRSWHPDASLDEVRRRTGFAFDATGATPTPLPGDREIAALRALDPDGQFERDAHVALRVTPRTGDGRFPPPLATGRIARPGRPSLGHEGKSTMSDETAEQVRGRRQLVSLNRLYLDPNNFRFVDHPEYRPVSPEHVFDADVQRRTTGFVLGRHQENVRDLIASIKENGWLDIDPILAQRKDAGRFLVVEGNRRVATLKYLQRRYDEDAIDLGKLDSAWFSRVPVLLYGDADERDHMVMMGLHHISGKRRWPAVNRARAMEQLLPQFHNDADAVCRALGVSKREFNLSVRTLALVNAYRDSDYGDQFQSDQYNLFREILKSEATRNWLGWNHATCTASNGSNLERPFLVDVAGGRIRGGRG